MNFSAANLLAGFIFGVIGWYMFRFSKKNGNLPNIFIGIALMSYSYFIDNPYLVWGIGIILSIFGYRFRKY